MIIMVPRRTNPAAMTHKRTLGSITISTPREMNSTPGMNSQTPENDCCIIPLHTDAMGHIAIGVGVALEVGTE